MYKDAVARYVEAERQYFVLEGVAPAERYLNLDRPHLRVRVLELGAGEPVLFVHGGGGSAAQWAPLLARIHGRRLLAVDRPGCGLTSAFDNRGVDLRAHAVDFLSGVLDALAIEAVDVVANSMGATWSVWLTLERTDRVRSLAFLGSPALIAGSGAPLPYRLLGVPVLNRLMYAMEPPSDAHGRKTFTRIGHDPATLPDEATTLQGRTEALPTYRAHWLSLMENIFPGARQAVHLTLEELRQVKQPVRFIWGERDPFGPPSAGEAACRVMPNASLMTVAAGHLPWVDEPDQCAGVVQELLDHQASLPAVAAAPRALRNPSSVAELPA
ncbi:MAG TPA: alpha/beta hydrolase [Candidatus Limnocylindrales bacterium]|nr:alpha/beta hydrolase [Candidatus Limnocylindrales bacterium]